MEQLPRALDLARAAALAGGRLVSGDPARTATGVAPPDQAGPGDITLVASPSYERMLQGRVVAAVVVGPGRALPGYACIEAADPRRAFDRLVAYFAPPPWLPDEGVHPTAVVGEGTRLGAGVRVGARVVLGRRVVLGDRCVVYPGVVVGDDVEIGEETTIHANAVIRERVRVGRRVVIHAGAVIGSEGFGFATDGGVHRRRPQGGTVILEDDVEVGANCAIDRASAGATVVGRGTKIDNLVQLAHNVRLGPGCLVAAQSGIAGSARLGRGVVLAGQVGISDHRSVGDGAVVYARSAVFDDVAAGARVAGTPAITRSQAMRVWALAARLPELFQRVRRLEARLGLEPWRKGGVSPPEGGAPSGEGEPGR